VRRNRVYGKQMLVCSAFNTNPVSRFESAQPHCDPPYPPALLILCRQRIFRERMGRMGGMRRIRSWGDPSCINKSGLTSHTSHISHTSLLSPTFF